MGTAAVRTSADQMVGRVMEDPEQEGGRAAVSEALREAFPVDARPVRRATPKQTVRPKVVNSRRAGVRGTAPVEGPSIP